MRERVALEFTDPAGDALRIEWDGGGLAALEAGEPPAQPPWRLAGELDWDEIESVRVFSARLGERLLAVAAIRPRGAGGHGDEVTAAALGDVDGFEGLDRVLISTEGDDRRGVHRIGLELYPTEESLPLRVAGDAAAHAQTDEPGVARATVAFDLRGAGDRGAGVLDVLRRG